MTDPDRDFAEAIEQLPSPPEDHEMVRRCRDAGKRAFPEGPPPRDRLRRPADYPDYWDGLADRLNDEDQAAAGVANNCARSLERVHRDLTAERERRLLAELEAGRSSDAD